jgi:hypothetical protein
MVALTTGDALSVAGELIAAAAAQLKAKGSRSPKMPARRFGRRKAIRGIDATGGTNHATGLGGGLWLGERRTVLWYQGRSRVVPEWCRGGKGVRGAVLSIANAYVSQPQAPIRRPPCDPQAIYKPYTWEGVGTHKPPVCDPQATPKPPSSQENATGLGGEPRCFTGMTPASQLGTVARAVGLNAFWACGRFGAVARSIAGLEFIYAII